VSPATDPPRSDTELLRAHVDGDAAAFGELVARHTDRLWAVALRTLGDPEEAADALQDALLSAFRHASGFRGQAAVTTWLHRIVVNACLDRIRRRRSRPTDPLPEIEGHDPVDARSSAFAEDRDVALDIAAALASLPPDARAAVVLVDLQGFSVADAAAVLDCPVGTVKSRCARARARLAPMLSHLAPGADRPGAGTADPARDVPSLTQAKPAHELTGPAGQSTQGEQTG